MKKFTQPAPARPAAYLFALAALALLLALGQAREARAQWATSGSNISNTNPGNVGVGTATPGEKLVVNGNTVGGNANGRTLLYSTYDSQGNVSTEVGYGTVTASDVPYPSLVLSKNLTGPNNLVGQISFANRSIADGGEKRTAGIISWTDGATNSGTLSLYTTSAGAYAERLRIDRSGNVGVGTAAPARQLNVHQSAGGAKGLLLSGDEFYQSGNGGADGVAILLGVNRPGNRQLWIGDSTALGSATLGMVRYMTGTSLPYVDATTGDGLTRLNVGFATATTNALVGANDVSVVQPASKLSVMGNLSVGFNYPATAAPSNGAIIEGNVGIGTSAPTERLHVNGNLKVTGNIEAKYQDVAEWVPTTHKLAAGTVVILDPARSNHVLASASPYDTSVAGVVSEQPGLILGEGGEGKVMVATTGRVKVKVDATRGPIKIGDLLVTSDVAGVAMKSEPITVGGRRIHAPGTIIGKALEPLAKGVGEILVLLSMQ